MAESDRPDRGESELVTRVPPVLIDVVLGVLVCTAIALAISAKVEPEALEPDGWAYLFAVVLGALMLLRRCWPAGVLIATVVLLFGYYALGYPAVGVAVPVAGAVYSAAEQGRLRLAIAVSTLVLVLSTVYRLGEEPAARLLGFEGAQNLVLLVAVIALGDSLRARRELRRQSRLQAERAEREHERAARRGIEEERLRIAREVHDVLAHSVSAISIQSVVALESLPGEPDNAAAALRSIRAVTSQALTELRSAVGVLRDHTQYELAPVSGLADLERLVATAAASGLQVNVELSGFQRTLPLIVDAAGYRIVQESITNVLRHSASAQVTVEIDYRPKELHLSVRNAVAGQPVPLMAGEGGAGQGGFGIAGMRERAELLGGSLRAEPTTGGGFQVNAVLPIPMGVAE